MATGSSLVFDCETVAASPQNYLVTTAGIFLSVATGSLKFAATPNAASSNTGSFSGTLQVSDGTQTFSGPATGSYFLQP